MLHKDRCVPQIAPPEARQNLIANCFDNSYLTQHLTLLISLTYLTYLSYLSCLLVLITYLTCLPYAFALLSYLTYLSHLSILLIYHPILLLGLRTIEYHNSKSLCAKRINECPFIYKTKKHQS